ncbi:3-oxoadipate enol-lactonase [Cereibacter sphaeroides]|uniref:3-oxoadipate enol-lactonase n=1 Tax=Cereibacter sphaeroides TaxID=1063 RepID=UPI001F2DA430|nr:3-oxoadipate enol-lactonase [Cereibacter sphaeroides]MCE6961340.1 3-oxoadipate enol-lactonase [Cereibacter sphaeroides]MCE6970326.1 3-oxoadipate enol-lactonase [Cereibacter sphaeroides]MCE6973979.1 3-oxoadipate enol-lactonase [Cereibacter sphaeroides]
MPEIEFADLRLHYRDEGTATGAPVVFAHALGSDLRIWDNLIPLLPQELRLVRYDLRGHGLSEVPEPPYAMGALIRDAERLMDALSLRDAVFVGCSIGGMIAQGIAVKRLDLIRALVLCDTAAKIGTAELWQDRIDQARSYGLESLADPTMKRWFPPAFRASPEGQIWRERFIEGNPDGYAGGAAAIAGTDFYSTTARLTLPTLAIVGSEDGSTPPDLVRETAGLIKGSRFEIIRGAGHVPSIDKPAETAALITAFLKSIGHV